MCVGVSICLGCLLLMCFLQLWELSNILHNAQHILSKQDTLSKKINNNTNCLHSERKRAHVQDKATVALIMSCTHIDWFMRKNISHLTILLDQRLQQFRVLNTPVLNCRHWPLYANTAVSYVYKYLSCSSLLLQVTHNFPMSINPGKDSRHCMESISFTRTQFLAQSSQLGHCVARSWS